MVIEANYELGTHSDPGGLMSSRLTASSLFTVLCLALSVIPLAAQSASGGPMRTPATFAFNSPPASADSVGLSVMSPHADAVLSRSARLSLSDRRQESCSGQRSTRILEGVLLGALIGGTIGVLHGLAGHPGLPHTGLDVPDVFEYSPLFTLAGAIVGGQVAPRPRCA